MSGFLAKLKHWWETADRTQRMVTVAGGGFLLLLLIGTFVIASRPKMSLVFANLTDADAGSVQLEIENMGITCQLSPGGNISVPSDKVMMVRARLAQNNKLPKAPHPGYESLKDMGMMNTPSVERERLKTMLEGELARTVEFFDGVDSARVHISFGIDSPIISEKKEAQASVTISEKGEVKADQGRAMANLVASAVPGLDVKRVSIFSRDGRAIYDGSQTESSMGTANSKLDLEKQEAARRRDELQQTLNRVVGQGNAIVMVDVGLNADKIRTESTEPTKAPLNKEQVKENLTGDATTTPPAPTGGTPSTPGGGASTNSNGYSMTHVNEEHGTIHTEVEKASGDLTRMAVTVFVNEAKADPKATDGPKTKAEADALTQSRVTAVNKAVGNYLQLPKDPANPDAYLPKEGYTSEIISYPFDKSQEVASEKAGEAAASSSKMQQILQVVPILALVVLAFVVMRQVGKAAKSVPITYSPALAAPGAPVLTTGPQSLPTPVAHNRAEEALTAAIQRPQAEPEEEIPDIDARMNRPLEQLKKMGNDKPEVVATLIKSWLLEDRR